MPKNIQIFKGGFDKTFPNGQAREERKVVNQRPADGHLKSGMWEDHIRVNRHRFKCDPTMKLEVGDVIGIHVGLTFGVIDGLGIAVITPEEGLKLKVVTDDPTVSLDNLDVSVYAYDENAKKFVESTAGTTFGAQQEIGTKVEYYAGYAKPGSGLIRVLNSVQIGLEVVELPANGLQKTFDIESRLHMRQVVRPPACMECC